MTPKSNADKNHSHFLHLLEKYNSGTASEAERKFVDEYMDMLDTLDEEKQLSASQYALLNATKAQLLQSINSPEYRSIGRQAKTFTISKRIVAAASILLITGFAGFWHLSGSSSKDDGLTEHTLPNELIKPGTNKAVLTLSDGTQLTLNDSSSQIIADGGISINKQQGLLTYNTSNTEAQLGSSDPKAKAGFNTMSTPRGGQYRLVLPDGSKVWLNSASSIKYPTLFKQNSRTVELTGEAYFEITEDKSKPFVVATKKMKVNVLGTGFNVNAYEDEPAVSTTLIHGSVKIITDSGADILKPGQQAGLNYSSSKLTQTNANIEEVLAWKEGKLKFDGTKIQNIMRQISRWYDVEIDYKGNIPETEFAGSILRTESPATLLKVLELTKEVHFIIQGKKIIVVAGPKSPLKPKTST